MTTVKQPMVYTFASMAPSVMLTALATAVLVVMLAEVAAVGAQDAINSNQTEAADFLAMYDTQYGQAYNRFLHHYWQYESNITDENEQDLVDAELQLSFWKQNMSDMAAQFNTSGFPAAMKRQFHFIQDIGTAALKNATRLKQLNELLGGMSAIYNKAQVCVNKTCLPLEPDLNHIFQTSRDEKWLRILWLRWRDATGLQMRNAYDPFVNGTNEAAQSLGYADTGAYWRSRYETESFEEDVAALFEELRPFYQQLHAFVRRRLKKLYGEEVFPSSGHIPAHLLGSMHGLSWLGIEDLVMPFPEKPKLDITVTEQMVKQNYTARRIYEVAEDFFTSLGLDPMPDSFWTKSMLEKPTDGRQVACHASAWNFENGTDFRIRQCTQITLHHFEVAHHEMGHIAYFQMYRHLPSVFREGANPGFHEAVGDTISLSVQTPKHLHKIGLLPTLVEDGESDLNYLMTMALQKIASLPFGYLVDQWRWSVFRGDTTPDNYTQAWWDLRCNLQGVSSPVNRTEIDFDPGSVFHVTHHVSYIRYFVSYVIQFQFHKALCEAAGHRGPLHTCDIYNSTQAGDKLKAMLSKGSSQKWTKPFKALTGRSKMSAQPLIEFFQPLMDHLKEANRQNGEEVGWTHDCSPKADVSAGHRSYLSFLVTILGVIVIVIAFD